jgi:glycosyltransferase involved in cell wall biosynthesis
MISNSSNKKDIEIVVFGGIDKKTQTLHKSSGIRFMGRIDDEEHLAMLYSAADVMCVPSIQESFGLVALEAMSCGVPVVAYNTSGLRDVIVDGATGFLVSPFDRIDYVRKIFQILRDVDLAKKMSIHSRARAINQFDFKIIASLHIALYESLIC